MDSIPPRLWALVVVVLAASLAACRTQSSLARRRRERDPRVSQVGNNPRYSSSFGAIAVAVVLSAAAMVRFDWAAWQGWLLGINAVSLGYYGWDKVAAKFQTGRVPEATLHLLAASGGTFGAMAGQQFFHHESTKPGFQRIFWVIAIVQFLLIIWLVPIGDGAG